MRIIIGGDIAVKKNCEALFENGETKALFNDTIDILSQSFATIVNLECTITEKDTAIKKIGPNIKAPLNTAKVLKEAGVTHCALSNNHIFDYGKEGMKDTFAQLDKYGIGYTGFGENKEKARENLVLTDGKITVSVIAVCEHEYTYALENRMGAREYDPYDTNDDISEAKKNSDYVIVLYHGGKEECQYPSPRLLKACRSMIKHGADVVLCQHSHCIGCYEKYMHGHILYGQGNFHFICKEYENSNDAGYIWNTGFLTKIDIENELNIEFIPCVAKNTAVSLAKGEEKDRILSDFAKRNDILNNGVWYEKWQEFARSQERYNIIPEELKEEIAHYFDCEAHMDVCKEIFKTYNHTNEIDN